MDTGKLLKVIDDVESDEAKYDIQAELQKISNSLEQSQPEAVNKVRDRIKEKLLESRISDYALSDYQVLEKLGAENMFGPGTYQSLEDILGSQSHEVPSLLTAFINDRTARLNSMKQLAQNLREFEFKSRALEAQQYEIGFVLPESYADVQKTQETIKDLGNFLNALAEATGKQQPLKIKYVSNGSIQLFVNVGLELANSFDLVLEYALEIYAAMNMFDGIKKKYKKFKDKKRRKKMEEETELEKKEQVEKLIDEMLTKLRLPDQDSIGRVKRLFIGVLEHLEGGVSAEVQTPLIEAPDEPPEDADATEKKQYTNDKKAYKSKKKIDERNKKIFILQQNNFYGMDTKFLNANNEKGTVPQKKSKNSKK